MWSMVWWGSVLEVCGVVGLLTGLDRKWALQEEECLLPVGLGVLWTGGEGHLNTNRTPSGRSRPHSTLHTPRSTLLLYSRVGPEHTLGSGSTDPF